MKRVLAILVTLCMVMTFLPVVSLAQDISVDAVRTAYFNNGSEWKLYDTSTNSDNILVASSGSDSWQAESTFKDTDGVVTKQTSLSGTGFASPRNAVVSFELPKDVKSDEVAEVTLAMTVKNVKQVTSGVRLAVYGNSIAGTWSQSSGKSVFGASSSSGLSSLECLGLTDAILAGNQTGETASGETITLSTKALATYVAKMIDEGKTEVTFRLATPLGGVRIYSYNTTKKPTLTIKTGKTTSVQVKTVYMDGNAEVGSESTTVENVVVGETYTHQTPQYAVEYNSKTYVFDSENSTLSTVAKEDGTSTITVVYTKFDESKVFSGYEVEDEGAWCWFADPRSITYKNDEGTLDFSIIGYIDIHGDIKATQINHINNEVSEVLIRSNIQPDDHNNPTFLVLPDERIMVFYSRHTDEACFWYRVTSEKGDLTTLGEEKCLKTEANTTYPSPFILSDDPSHIYLCWRGINWHPTIAKLDLPDENGDTKFVYGPYQMVQSTAARPYAKYASNGKDKLYVTYTLGHPDNEAKNWVFFNKIDIKTMTLEDINGNTLSTIANGTLSVNASDATQTSVVDTENMRDWVWQVAEGSDGNPVIAMVRINGGKTSHDYYYVKWNGSKWVKTFLANGGGHFHQTAGLEMCYSGGMAIDPDNTNVIYCSQPIEGVYGKVYEIVKYTMSDDGTTVESQEQITKNSKKNNVRPFVLANSEDKDIRLIWMHGDYYDWIVSSSRPNGYCTAVMAENPLPKKTVDLDDALINEDYFSAGGAFEATKNSASVKKASVSDEFSVSADIFLDGDYTGTIVDIGDVKVKVENKSTHYGATQTGDRARVVLEVKGEEYVTSNVYGSSDCWSTYGRGTGGNYGVEKYDGYVNHIITYDGENLTLYRNGLVDIKIAVQNVCLNNVEIGGFDGLADNVYVFDRVINRDEIRTIADAKAEAVYPDENGDVAFSIKYVDIDNSTIKTEEKTFPKGTDICKFSKGDKLVTENTEYVFDSYEEKNGVYTVKCHKTTEYGENLISLSSLTRASDGAALGWEEVSAKSVNPNADESDVYIHLTGDATGGHGQKTMRTFVPIEGGKTYLVENVIYNNKSSDMTWGAMSAVVATGDAVYGTHSGLTIYSHVEYGGTNSWSAETTPTIIGSKPARADYNYPVGEHKASFVIKAPENAKNIMISYGAWGDTEYYYGDFSVREIKNVEITTITFDGKEQMTYGAITLGEDGNLPEGVVGYSVERGDVTKFVNAGELQVEDGDVITTARINVAMVDGAQVRYGAGLDENGKIKDDNGLRFIAQVDKSNEGDYIQGYGIKIQAEESENVKYVDATKWQDEDETIFTVAITNLKITNYNRNYTATAYATVSYSDGTTAKVFAPSSTKRSIYKVATGILKNNNDNYNDDEYTIENNKALYNVLNAYVNMVGVRLTMNSDGSFEARSDGAGKYTGEIFFDVQSEKLNDGVYRVTVTPLESFGNRVTIMDYWTEFVRINNNHTVVAANITDSVANDDGGVTFTFTVPKEN